MKQNDWVVASLSNPSFNALDFKDIAGMNLSNTQFLALEDYLKMPFIRNQKQFQDNNGNFVELKFNDFYKQAAQSFKDFSTEDSIDNYEYSMWDIRRPQGAKVKDIGLKLETIKNPEHISIGVSGINAITPSKQSRRELAQNSKIYDPKTGTFINQSVNDLSLFKNPLGYIASLFDEPLVYATYDEDTVETDPVTGQKTKHSKGEWKVNDDGEYYVEKLNGRSLLGKQVVSASDYLTDENSTLNHYDFMDSDDLEKSTAGVVAKNIAAVLPMFIPYVSTAYSGLLVGRELAKSLPMAYGMLGSFLGNKNPDSKLANTISAYGQKFTGSTSDYAQENTFTLENFGNLMSDVALQWGQQSLIANSYNKLTSGGATALETATQKAQNAYLKNYQKYLQDSFEGKISPSQLNAYVGTSNVFDIGELIKSGKWAQTSLGKAALDKYLPAAQKVMANRNRAALDLSLVYMALISNTDVYDSILQKGGTPGEAAAIAFGSSLGMFSVDKYLGLGEMFFQKDPAKIALRQTAIDNANLYMKGKTVVADTTTQKGILNTIKRGADLGKKIVSDFTQKYQNGTLGIIGKAFGEGLEETSEELVTDFTKNLGELAGRLGYFSQTDYGAWENAGDRYVMSFLGGFAGGGIYGIKDKWNNRNNSTKDFQTDITDLIRQGKKDDLIKELDNVRKKGMLGSEDLSYDTVQNEDGTSTYISSDDSHKSQAQTNYEGLVNLVNQLDLILNENQLNLSDDDLFDKMVLGEYRKNALTDFLKGNNLETVKEVSYISQYQTDFKNLTNNIINIENLIKEKEAAPDEDKRKNPSWSEEIENLKKQKEELIKEKEYLFGEGSLGYVEKTLFAMDTNLSGRFLTLNINQFARQYTGKSILDLTPSELEDTKKQYDEWKKNRKLDLDKAFKIYKEMEKQILPELKDLQNTDFYKLAEELKKLRDSDPGNKLLNVNDKLDSETDEEYESLKAPKEGESEEDWKARVKKHEEAVMRYNQEMQFKYMQDYAKNPITTTDLRAFSARINYLRKQVISDIINSRGFKLEKTDSVPNDITQEDIDNFTSAINSYVESNGTSDRKLLDKFLEKESKKFSSRLFEEIQKELKTNGGIKGEIVLEDDEKENIKTRLEEVSKLPNKEELGISSDYSFEDNGNISYKDLLILTIYEKSKTDSFDKALEHAGIKYITDDVKVTVKDGEETKTVSLTEYLKLLYSQYLLSPESFIKDNEESLNSTILLSKTLLNLITDKLIDNGNEFIENFDIAYKSNSIIRALNSLESASFINNPVLPLLKKISKFSKNSDVDIEKFLQDIYEEYKAGEKASDFTLSDTLLRVIDLLLQDLDTAQAYVYAASLKTSNGQPVGHNKSINDFVKNHKDTFGKVEELPEINEDAANMIIGEIDAYKRELRTWKAAHEVNSALRDKAFIKASKALNTTIGDFFKINREAFKFDDVDLLDGYEDLTLDESLSSSVVLLELLYKNAKESGLSISEILNKIGPKIFGDDNIALVSAKFDESLEYGNFTEYNKFQLIVSSIAVGGKDFYKQLKDFLNDNDSLAPIAILEYVARLTFAQNQKPETINEALEWLKAKNKSKRDIVFNTTITVGVGGSGKTFAVTRLNYKDGKDVWVTGPTVKQQENLKKSLPESESMSIEDLFNEMFEGNVPKEEDLYDLVREDKKDLVVLKGDLKFKKLDKAPKAVVIDEATHISMPRILAIALFCKLNNINLQLIGDEYQNGYVKDGIGSIEQSNFIAWRTPELFISLRNSNATKVQNQAPLLLVIDILSRDGVSDASVYEKYIKNLTLQHYNQDFFRGELITNELSEDLINKMRLDKDASIGFIGDLDSKYYKQLVDAGFKVSSPMSTKEVQGQEFDYVVIDKNWELTIDSNWHNNNVRILYFAKDLYTMITRSSKGTIIIDNGLSSIVKNAETTNSGEYTGISKSIENFRKTRIPEIEKAIKDAESINPTEEPESKPEEKPKSKPTKKESKSSEEPTTLKVKGSDISEKAIKDTEEPKPNSKINNEELDADKEKRLEDSVNNPSKAVCFSTVSYSGIDTSGVNYINDSNSTSDLGIFVMPGEEVKPGDKKEVIIKLLKLKSFIIFGTDNYDNAPVEIKDKFAKEAFDNIEYYIKVEEVSNNNRLIGLTEGVGLSNDKRAIGNNKIVKIVARIKDKSGKSWDVSLGGMNNPETWKKNLPSIKAAIDKNNKLTKELKENLKAKEQTNYENYATKINNWIEEELEIRINKPTFALYTRLESLGNSYRLSEINSNMSPYNEHSPIQVMSEPYIIVGDVEEKRYQKMKGKAVMFVSSNLNYNASDLRAIYEREVKEGLPLTVRMVKLNNVGVSFSSLSSRKWQQFYKTNTKGELSFPMELLPFAVRMYIAMWNYRASLLKFVNEYNKAFGSDNDTNITELCKQDNTYYYTLKKASGKDIYTELEYRDELTKQLTREGKIDQLAAILSIWNFNDSLASSVKELRLGYDATHGAYIRRLTNLGDSGFYDIKTSKEKEKPINGIYLNPQTAKLLLELINGIFNEVVDKIITPLEGKTDSYISTELKDLKGWFKKIDEEAGITLAFSDVDGDEHYTTKLNIADKSRLTALPIVMVKLGSFLNSYLFSSDKEKFVQNDYYKLFGENSSGEKETYNWLKICNDLRGKYEFGLIEATNDGSEDVERLSGIVYADKEAKTGLYDSRVYDFFNMMFHGVVAAPKENDFTGTFRRAYDAPFKYGIFIDPAPVKRTSDEGETFAPSFTNKNFYTANVAASGTHIIVDIEPYKEKSKSERTISSETKTTAIDPDLFNYVKNNKEILNNSGIEVDENSYSNLTDYIEAVLEALLDKLGSNFQGLDFNNIIESIDSDGTIHMLKNNELFNGKTITEIKAIPNGKDISFEDGSSCKLTYNKAKKSFNFKNESSIEPEVNNGVVNKETLLNNVFKILEDNLFTVYNGIDNTFETSETTGIIDDIKNTISKEHKLIGDNINLKSSINYLSNIITKIIDNREVSDKIIKIINDNVNVNSCKL